MWCAIFFMCVYHRASFICRTVVCQSKRFDWQVGVQTPPLDSTSILSYVNEENRLCVHFSIKQSVSIVFFFFLCVSSLRKADANSEKKNKGKLKFLTRENKNSLIMCLYLIVCMMKPWRTPVDINLYRQFCALTLTFVPVLCACVSMHALVYLFFIFLLYFWQSTVIRITTCIKEIHENKILYESFFFFLSLRLINRYRIFKKCTVLLHTIEFWGNILSPLDDNRFRKEML